MAVSCFATSGPPNPLIFDRKYKIREAGGVFQWPQSTKFIYDIIKYSNWTMGKIQSCGFLRIFTCI